MKFLGSLNEKEKRKVRKKCLAWQGERANKPVGRYRPAYCKKKDEGHYRAKNEIDQDGPQCQPQVWHDDGKYVKIKIHQAYFGEENGEAVQKPCSIECLEHYLVSRQAG